MSKEKTVELDQELQVLLKQICEWASKIEKEAIEVKSDGISDNAIIIQEMVEGFIHDKGTKPKSVLNIENKKVRMKKMSKGKEWVRNQLLKEMMIKSGNPIISEYEEGIVSGLRSAVSLVDKMDEPEKVILPKYVADWYEEMFEFIDGYSEEAVYETIKYVVELNHNMNMRGWISVEVRSAPGVVKRWIDDNQNIMIDALYNGYEPEKEQWHRLKSANKMLKNGYLVYNDVLKCYMVVDPEKIITARQVYKKELPFKTEFTEEELKEIDETGFTRDPVEEEGE